MAGRGEGPGCGWKHGAAVEKRALTPAQYGDLVDVAPELEWLANISNPKTRRAMAADLAWPNLSNPDFSAADLKMHICTAGFGRR